MARPIPIWLSSLTLCALSACGGADSGFFSDVVTSAAAGSSHTGAVPQAGSSSSSGNPGGANSGGAGGRAGAGGSAGQEAGSSNGGTQTGGGASAGGRGGAHSGGTGGRAGAGGSGAASGHAGAPGGPAGAGGSNQELSCADLLKQANAQLEAARACNPDAKAVQCTGTVSNQCNCEVSVQKEDSPETKAYLATLKLLAKKDCTAICTTLVCRPVVDGECKQSGSGNMGLCTASSNGPFP